MYKFDEETNAVYLEEFPNLPPVFKFDSEGNELTRFAKNRIVNELNFGVIVAQSFRQNDEPTMLSFMSLYNDISSAFYNLIKK